MLNSGQFYILLAAVYLAPNLSRTSRTALFWLMTACSLVFTFVK